MNTTTNKTEAGKITRNRAATAAASILLAAAWSTSVLSLTGCNTTKGMGEDIEDLGDSISDGAEDAQH